MTGRALYALTFVAHFALAYGLFVHLLEPHFLDDGFNWVISAPLALMTVMVRLLVGVAIKWVLFG